MPDISESVRIIAQVDPLVSLMKVEKVPDSTYDMIGGLDQQIKEIKEVQTITRQLRLPFKMNLVFVSVSCQSQEILASEMLTQQELVLLCDKAIISIILST